MVLFLLLAFTASVARAEIMVGDKAPVLQTGRWIQGDPISSFDTNHIYIVEFWATWCGPCIGSIPHLNQLWQQFKDKGVIIIGQDIWDSDNAVAPFVRKMGSNMTYRVALDDKSSSPDGWMAQNWWPRKVNQHGIPTAVIINRDGRIAWIGHPMALDEKVLDDIVSGRQDLAKAAVEYQKEWTENQKFQELQLELNSALSAKKWNDAAAVMDQLTNGYPHRQQTFAFRCLRILLGQKKFAGAYDFARTFSDSHATNDFWQNELAWDIVAADSPDDHCLNLAESMAERAVQLTKEQNGNDIDTLARAQFMLGKKPEAIATEEKAINATSDTQAKTRLEATLASYQAGTLPTAE